MIKNDQELEAKIIEVLAFTLDVPKDQINRSSSVETVTNWDSVNHMNLVLALEEEFGVIFKEEEVVELISYELIHSYLKEKLKV